MGKATITMTFCPKEPAGARDTVVLKHCSQEVCWGGLQGSDGGSRDWRRKLIPCAPPRLPPPTQLLVLDSGFCQNCVSGEDSVARTF